MKPVPMRIGFVVGLVLAVPPWIFGFVDDDAKLWVPHLVVGIAVIGYALITRTDATPTTFATRPSSSSSRVCPRRPAAHR